MVTRTEQKMVTGTINGQAVTVPAGTYILDAARMAGIEVPNLCYQPLMRPWGSCRICTVEILGKRGGLIESCATPLTEGMEVLTHSPECVQARQYILQMYLIDHALDCPTCDKSGQCYLQDNTYLYNVNANPYRRPKLAQSYEHFSSTIDYKWDRCIMCNRCTRVCDEIVGVVAIESANRSLEATITPAYGNDLSETTCTNCGMCIAVCPVGALTDRHFGHHPWELDTTETICGHCDVGCTVNIESARGIVRCATHLWERGVNHGYTCEKGRWGHERVQSAERIFYPRVRSEDGADYEVSWDEALEQATERLAHYQGDQFAALASGENTNEEAYLLQQFTRAVMGTNNVDRLLSPEQRAVERGLRVTLGQDVSHTNNMQELFSDAKNLLVVGPNIFGAAPIASYWINHSRLYRESRIVVVSTEHYPLCDRAALWLKPNPGTTPLLLQAMAKHIVRLGLDAALDPSDDAGAAWRASLNALDMDEAAETTGVPAEQIRRAAIIWVTANLDGRIDRPEGGFPPAAIYQTAARQNAPLLTADYPTMTPLTDSAGDAAAIAAMCANLAVLSGNIGRPGGGVASPRGPANYQGVTDMGCVAGRLPGDFAIDDAQARARFEAAWLPRWAERALTSNGFVPVRSLPNTLGLAGDELVAAIEAGQVKAMFIEGRLGHEEALADPRLEAALDKLELLIVVAAFDSPLTRHAHVVLPQSLYIEKDGTFTSFDRTVQRVRSAVPAMGDARPAFEIIPELARRMGYGMAFGHPSQVMTEISTLVRGYAGVTYARLERGGIVTPVAGFGATSETVLVADGGSLRPLNPQLAAVGARWSV